MHHAHLIIGEQEVARATVSKMLEKIESDINIIRENYETFGIDESRGLIERSSRKNWEGKREIIILAARNYTAEAQNALLKLFEEPRAGLHFFILGRQATDFLPTLRSRLMIVEGKGISNNQPVSTFSTQFLLATPAERLDLIAKELKKELPRESWLPFLNSLEKSYHEISPLNESALIEISTARKYLTDPASSPRLLFEHLAFVLPRVVE